MRTTALCALLSLSALLASGEARAQAKKDAPAEADKSAAASKHFKSGVAFYKDRDFSAALVEFKLAYELLPNYNVLYNLGQTARELKDWAAALSAFERYLRDGGSKVPAPRAKEVQAAVEELRQKVGKIKITTNVEGAEILVDDVAVGKAPLPDSVLVNAGRRKLSATSSGYTPAQRMVDVAAAAETDASLELVKIGASTPPPPPPPEEPPPNPSTPIGAWIALAGTGAGAIVTGVMGGLAISARGTLKDELGKFPGNKQAISDAQSKTKALALGADVTLGITAAGAVTTAVLFALASRAPQKAPEKAPPAVSVQVGPTGVWVSGVF